MPRTKGALGKKNPIRIAAEEARDSKLEADLKSLGCTSGYAHLCARLNSKTTRPYEKDKIAAMMLPFERPRLSASMVRAQVETTPAPTPAKQLPQPEREDPREVFGVALLGDTPEVRKAATMPCGLENLLAIWKKRTEAITADRAEAASKAEEAAAQLDGSTVVDVSEQTARPQGEVTEATLLPVPVKNSRAPVRAARAGGYRARPQRGRESRLTIRLRSWRPGL